MQLYNTLSAEERKKMINDAGKQRLTLSFYSYAHISSPTEFRNDLFLAWDPLGVLGRIYVAKEGINAQLSVPADHFYTFRDTLEVYPFLQGIRLNIAIEQDDHSFLKLTIKVRDKIVADGLNDESFDVTNKGVHLKAKEFNDLLEKENTIVVDMRNHYESEIGHFVGAITPDVDTFRESLPIIEQQLADCKENKNVLMYCTGGIRCEKASAYFKHKGFKHVYQLEGGIIDYARQVQTEGLESKFIGKNFVFDHRLGERITDDIVAQCHQCGGPCDTHTNCANEGCHLLFIQCSTCADSMEGCCSTTCLATIHLPDQEQKLLRKGIANGNKVFKKGKSAVLTYKNANQAGTVISKTNKKAALKANPERKKYLGKAIHYFPKAGVADFFLEDGPVMPGQKIIISGPTTGAQSIEVKEFYVHGVANQRANAQDIISLKVPFRVRLSDKLFLKLNAE